MNNRDSYAVFATPFNTIENNSDKDDLSNAYKILRSSKKKFRSFRTQLEKVLKGEYIGIHIVEEFLVIIKYNSPIKPAIQLLHILKAVKDGSI